MQLLIPIATLSVLVPFAGAASVHAQRAEAGRIAIVDVNVLPMDRERVLPRQTVVIESGVITRLGPGGQPPAGARVVDGRGKFLMPGLADLHVHLVYNSDDERRHLLRLFVANGVTTVLNMRGDSSILALRRAVAAGEVLGPELRSVGSYINQPFVTTPEQVEAAVVQQKQAGYDFVKLHGDLSREAYARLNAVARREGIRVIGHAPRNLGVEAMFEERQYAVAHAEEFIYDRTNSSRDSDLDQVEARIPGLADSMARTGIHLMPNLTGFRSIADQLENLDALLARPEMRYLPRSNQVGWGPATNPYTNRMRRDQVPGIRRRLGILQRLTRAFHRAGVLLLIGTDAMNTGVVPGYSAHDELAELVGAGLTPFQALRAATANAATFLGSAEQRGLVAPGHRADLVLLDENPLQDIRNSRRIAGVMVRGRWLARTDLDRILEELRSPRP